MKPLKALFIGRFQPFHNGHLDVLMRLRQLGVTKILFGIGTHDRGRTQKDPFTYDERVAIMSPALDRAGLPYAIYTIPDINDPPHYAAHVERIVKELDEDTVLFSGNPYTYNCFNHKYWVFMPSEKHGIHATQIREMMRVGEEWKKHVPKECVAAMEKIGAEKIVQGIR